MRSRSALRSLSSSLFFSCVLAAASAGTARADGPRIAVLPFDGPERISARLAVHRALDDAGLDLTTLDDAADAARRARVRGTARPHIDRALELADADATVQGRTEITGGDVTVRVVVRSGGGRSLLDRRVVLDGDESVLRELADAVRDALSTSPAPSLAARIAPSPSRPVAREAHEDRADDAPPPDEAERTVPWLVAGAGGSARLRDASFDTDDGARFHRAWYPTIDIAAELRPLHTATGTERGFFVRASFSHSLGLRSRTPDDTMVDTAFFTLAADLGLLVTVDRSWELGFAVGVGVDSFALGQADQVIVPSAVYGNLRPGVRARVHLVDEIVVLDLGVGYRWVFERGPISAAFGRGGESHGVDVGITLGGAIDMGFSWGISAELVAIMSQHHGEADLVAASGGRDIGLRLGARVGLALW